MPCGARHRRVIERVLYVPIFIPQPVIVAHGLTRVSYAIRLVEWRRT